MLSAHDLIGKYVQSLGTKKQGLLSAIFRPKEEYVSLSIKMHSLHFLRAETFITELEEIADADFPDFTVESMVLLLFNDFLKDARLTIIQHGVQRFVAIVNDLHDLYRRLFPRREITKQVASYPISKYDRLNQKIVYLPITLKKKVAICGEVYLFDAIKAGSKRLSLEQLIATLFAEFIEEVSRGNHKLIDTILSRI